jgi:hypothetical protein
MVFAEVLTVYPPIARIQFNKPCFTAVGKHASMGLLEGQPTLSTNGQASLGPLLHIIVRLADEEPLA